ncbi:MAG: hypothetical protein ACK4PI_14770, partial [Tepidisphaerales bacterium]
QDAFGNTVTSSTHAVQIAISSGTTGAVLSGTTVVEASGGAVSFPGISIDKSGDYTLVANATSLAPED